MMGGWPEEVWYSLLELAKRSEALGLGLELIVQRYLLAYEYRPSRAEPLVELARLHRQRQQYPLAHLFARRAIEIRQPNDLLFLDAPTYQWRTLDEFAVASFWIGRHHGCRVACEQLLASGRLPPEEVGRVSENRDLARAKLAGD
jgi:hypothetical protein